MLNVYLVDGATSLVADQSRPGKASQDVSFRRAMFSSGDGVLTLDLDEKIVAVPVGELERQVGG